MKTITNSILVILCTCLLSVTPIVAQKVYASIDQVPNIQLSEQNNAVSNPDGILSPEAVAQINNIVIGLRRATSIEVAVVAITSIGSDNTPEDFAIRLAEKWGVGKKDEDNGLLILLVSGDRFVRFEVGYGLEGVLNDAITRRIRDNIMLPHFSHGDWDTGMIEGVKAVEQFMTDPNSELRREAEVAERQQSMFFGKIVLIFGSIFAIILVAVIAARRARKCPKCGTVMKVESQETSKISQNLRLISTTYVCPKCGYRTTKHTKQHISTGGGFGGFGGGIGGGFGGGFGGGGGGGGSWGGGGFGGRGGTSRF